MTLALRTVLNASVRSGLIAPDAAAAVRRKAQRGGVGAVEAVCSIGRVPAASVYQAVAEAEGIPFVFGEGLVPEDGLTGHVAPALMQREQVLPVREADGVVWVAAATFVGRRVEQALETALGRPVRFALADPESLRLAIAGHVDAGHRGAPSAVAAEPGAADPVEFVDHIIREAFLRRASDIHLEPELDGFRVRFRVDGTLHIHKRGLPTALAGPVLSRVKVLAGLDIAESREPQDGGFSCPIADLDGEQVDIRVATAPTQYGERATLRLLGIETEKLTLERLGFPAEMQGDFRRLIARPHGLILITGPTGSGKTTTLYAALRTMDRTAKNVLTVEDPIEYPIPGVSQIQVDRVGKVSFARTLRSLLRHDPDVLMIGEIRDGETADIALRAAMTGHLVFSTLHTNTAAAAIIRLVDMGCEPYLVASTLTAAFAQRLVRRLCEACRTTRPATADEFGLLGLGEDATVELSEPGGCPRCQGTGYRGRTAVFEGIEVDGAIRRAILDRPDEEHIATAAGTRTTLRVDAVRKVLNGVTSLAEMRRVGIVE
jgi:type IV pilus assembly protein PilB